MRTMRLLGLIVTIALLAAERPVLAQRGGFSADMLMDRLDQNGNGRIDPGEMSESRMPLATMAEQAGIDASRGLSGDDMQRILERMQRSREEGGGFGSFDGDRGDRGDRGGSGGDRGGSGGDRGGFGADRGRGGSDRGSRGDDRSGRSTKPPEPPPRVTIALQSEYVPGDTNHDGQIAMSEWLHWKSRSALAEFVTLDRNGDGMLTPRELAKASTATPVELSVYFPTLSPAALQPSSGSSALSGSPMPAPATPGVTAPVPVPAPAQTPPTGSPPVQTASPASTSPGSTSADVQRHTASAQRLFQFFDRDRDGKITELEWRRSSRLKPRLEGAGADLSQPMSEEQFVGYYVKFQTDGSSI